MKQRGFTLVEVLVAVGIFAILAVAVGVYVRGARQRAQNTAILSAARTIAADHVVPLVSEFPQEVRWGGLRREKFLNARLYNDLRSTDLNNVYNYANPVSGNKAIIGRGGVQRKNPPAVYITNRNGFRYERIGTRRSLLKDIAGTIIIWMSRSDPAIEVFYIDAQGRRSEYLLNP